LEYSRFAPGFSVLIRAERVTGEVLGSVGMKPANQVNCVPEVFMGEQDLVPQMKKDEIRRFLNHLLADVRALEEMLDKGLIETGVRRIGAEQELFLVDSAWRPARRSMQLLEDLNDEHFTPELAQFNLEFNLDPMIYGGKCLSEMEGEIRHYVAKAREAARGRGGDVVMTGILPTLNKGDLDLGAMTPNPRYSALNEAMTRLRGGDYEFDLKGIDQIRLRHESIMVEACNTSFQVHFQVDPDEFASLYNAAQVAAGPVLAAAANSPLLFGKRLWWETRVGLFQQSVDTRRATTHLREQTPRVSFGRQWIRASVLEVFREDIARFRTILADRVEEDPFEAMAAGRAPSLKALRLHNGTVYRWNRACYGISEGRPHLRIENRMLPAGPTPADEIANAAFWLGLVSGIASQYGDVGEVFRFEEAQTNFFTAAQNGLNCQLFWLNGRLEPARKIILGTFLPISRKGLKDSGIDEKDIDHYLGIIEERVDSGKNGAQWQLSSLSGLDGRGPLPERLAAITSAMVARESGFDPVHAWDLARLEEGGGWQRNYIRVEQCMDTDLVTVNEHEPVDLVAQLMDWNNIRHVLVEDDEHHLVGIVSRRRLLRLIGTYNPELLESPMPVSEVMSPSPLAVSPETSTLEAIELMRRHQMSFLPVEKDGQLVGKVTERQFMAIARQLLEEKLREENTVANSDS